MNFEECSARAGRPWFYLWTASSCHWRCDVSRVRLDDAERRPAAAAAGTELWRPYFLYLLADVQVAAGQRSEALSWLRQARQTSGRNGDVFWDAEILRFEAELLAPADRVQAEMLLRDAIAAARAQGAVTLERGAARTLGLAASPGVP